MSDDDTRPAQPDFADEVTTPMSRMRNNAGRWLALALAVVLVVPLGGWVANQVIFARQGAAVAEAVPALADAVVLVNNLACDGRNGSGSGFAVELDGEAVVVTNRHVVDDASRVSVRALDGSTGPRVTGIRLSEADDVAVLELEEPPATTLPLGAAPDAGDAVRLVGFPGARPVTSAGSVDEVSRSRVALDLQVGGGASGAPLVDDDDRVVAQVVARRSDGTGIAIPAPDVAAAAAATIPAPGC